MIGTSPDIAQMLYAATNQLVNLKDHAHQPLKPPVKQGVSWLEEELAKP